MQRFLACFGCQNKTNNIVIPSSHFQEQQKPKQETNQQKLKLIQQQQKTKTIATLTFRDPEPNRKTEQITNFIQLIKNKTFKERKKQQTQFIKNNIMPTPQMFVVQKKWSQQYTIYLTTESQRKIRPVDNSHLLQGDQLAVGLAQKIDYYFVNQKVWEFIQRIYKGGPEIRKSNIISKNYIPVAGIVNNYYFCYLNTGVQVLFSIEEFVDYFKRKAYKSIEFETKINTKRIFCIFTNKIMKELAQITGNSKDLRDFSELFEEKFNHLQQHDCQQFLRYYLQKIQDQTNPSKFQPQQSTQTKTVQQVYQYYLSNHTSIVDQIFYGQCTNFVKCQVCNHISVNQQPTLELFVQIKGQKLQSCLNDYFAEEKLDDLYECLECKNKTKAYKKLSISKTPPYLMITLKRFTSTKEKNSQIIQYPQNLNIQKYCRKNSGVNKYTLQSIIIHKGTTSKGHYYCLTKRWKKWYYINDQIVKQIDIKQYLNQQAYILIYERCK